MIKDPFYYLVNMPCLLYTDFVNTQQCILREKKIQMCGKATLQSISGEAAENNVSGIIHRHRVSRNIKFDIYRVGNAFRDV